MECRDMTDSIRLIKNVERRKQADTCATTGDLVVFATPSHSRKMTFRLEPSAKTGVSLSA
jgi:hypothetical protein